MDAVISFWTENWRDIVIPVVVFVLSVIALFWLRRLAYNAFERWLNSHRWPADRMLSTVRWPSVFWCLIMGASLAIAERRTLVIDCDPQGNASSGLGLSREVELPDIYDCLVDGRPIEDTIQPAVHFPMLDVVPASRDLAGAEVELIERPKRERILREIVKPIRDRYEYILIDSPPSLGLLTLNALVAADTVLIPIQCEFYALEGLSQLLNTVRIVQRNINPELGIEGVLLTMFDSRLNLSKQVKGEAEEYFGAKVFRTSIPRNVRLAEAPSFGQPIALYDVLSTGARGYLSLAREIVLRDDERKGAVLAQA